MPAVHVVVSGRVQGVGFRWFVRTAARRLGVAGWVMNLPDGSVKVAAEAGTEALDSFIAELRRGPPSARVDGVMPGPPDLGDTLPDPFEIR